MEFEIQGLGIQNTAQGIRNPTCPKIGIQNPSSTDNTGIEFLEPGIRNPQHGIQNLRLSWTPLVTWGDGQIQAKFVYTRISLEH